MYKQPLYGKEWNWRNVKMETLDNSMLLREGLEKGFVVYATSPFFILRQ